MADYLQRYADEELEKLGRKIGRTYRQAAEEVNAKLKSFWESHKVISERMLKDVRDGKITQQDYKDWLQNQVFRGNRWKSKLDEITKVYMNADEEARKMVGDKDKDMFAHAANWQAKDTSRAVNGAVSFDMYDRKTVDRLIRDNPKMLPEWKINEKKDYIWNEKRVRNAVTQGIIQGESVYDIGKRLTTELAASNASKMDMFARTAVTGAQNAGRIERLHEAQEMGIKVRKKWLSAHDKRVRDAHIALDGDEKDIDEPFHNEYGDIMYPGDPMADPANTYNCRCTMIYVYPKYEKKQDEGETEQEETKLQEKAETKNADEKKDDWDNLSYEEKRREFDGGDELLEKERQERAEIEQHLKDLNHENVQLRNEKRAINRELDSIQDDNSEAAKSRRDELERRLKEIEDRRAKIPDEYNKEYAKTVAYNSSTLVDRAEFEKVEYRLPDRNTSKLTDDEIVSKISGGDMTGGSCASVAMCYVGQQEGFDVRDYRGGTSRTIFSQDARKMIHGIAEETGYPLIEAKFGYGVEPALEIVAKCEPGKQYYLCAGRHASIVRVDKEGNFEYLELQSGFRNGWKKAPKGANGKQDLEGLFGTRFGCDSGDYDVPAMIDVEGMKGSKLFHRALGYMNTSESKQLKGAEGFAK